MNRVRWLCASWVIAMLWSFGAAAGTTEPCGPDAPCELGVGTYYLSFPDDWDGATPLPAVVFFHGHRSSGLNVIQSANITRAFAGHGYLIIAPNGAARGPDGVRGWPARPDLDGARDDLAFLDEVIDDVARQVPLERDRILISGFSSGGSMVWMVACYEGAKFAGFVSVAGALRRPVPEGGCPGGPARMLHVHGFTDRTVPLEGRGIRDWHQGDVFESLSLLRDADQCRSNPDAIDLGTVYRCRIWNHCGSNKDIEFCLHDGGHMLPKGWADRARIWFETETSGS